VGLFFVLKCIQITEALVVESAFLDIDYHDGFVAYLNGQEVARNRVSKGVSDFDQLSARWSKNKCLK
jgi:hypothetical protein